MRFGSSAVVAVAVACAGASACSNDSSKQSAAGDSAATLMPAPAEAPSSAAAHDSIVRGTVKDVSDSALTLTTASGDLRIALVQPVKVFARRDATLARVTDHSFIGVTSVKEPDGTQRATEIHIFPEELRGLGEGSRPMSQPRGGAGSTMTNGSATMTNGSATMTNGSATMTNGAATMTNGASRGTAAGGTLTVQYSGGTQTISVPSGVKVTELAPTTTKLTPGASVVVPVSREPDGTATASVVMLAGGR